MSMSDSTDVPQTRKYIHHGNSYHPLWYRWCQMINRCHGNSKKKRYGGRGIIVCDRWRESFEAFVADMGMPPTPQHQIERKDNDGNYEPDNCRWATASEQARNRNRNTLYTIGGVTKCLTEWLEIYSAKKGTVLGRLERGWPIEMALTAPPRPGKRTDLDGKRAFCTESARNGPERMTHPGITEGESCRNDGILAAGMGVPKTVHLFDSRIPLEGTATVSSDAVGITATGCTLPHDSRTEGDRDAKEGETVV